MKLLLIILISLLLLSSPVIGNSHKGETLYLWETSYGEVWEGFGEKNTNPKYQGEVENGVPNGFGYLILPKGGNYVGEWDNGMWNGQGTYTTSYGTKYEGSWKYGRVWNGTEYDPNGKILYKYVNGKMIKQ